MDRERAKLALSLVLKSKKNIDIFEKYIYMKIINENKKELYNTYIYQICNTILTKELQLKEILQMLKEGKIGFDHPKFNSEKTLRNEHDEYLTNPFEVVKGLVKCPKCKSDRTLSYSKNDRSGDEALSVYATCFECKFSWRENN